MKGLKIVAFTDKGAKGLDMIKKELSRSILKWSLKKMKTKVVFGSNLDITIYNPSMEFGNWTDHPKSKEGILQLVDSFKEIGAEQYIDYELEAVDD